MNVAHIITKKVRLDADHARRLAALAKKRRVTESDVLRQGIDLVEQMERREQAIEGLIEMARQFPGPRTKQRYAFK